MRTTKHARIAFNVKLAPSVQASDEIPNIRLIPEVEGMHVMSVQSTTHESLPDNSGIRITFIVGFELEDGVQLPSEGDELCVYSLDTVEYQFHSCEPLS